MKHKDNENFFHFLQNKFSLAFFYFQDIDQWVTDAFYSYFPSLSESRENKKRELAQNRQKEYDEYVKQIPKPISKREMIQRRREQHTRMLEREQLTSSSSGSQISTDSPRPQTPKDRLIKDLQHVDLSAMLNTDVIEQRERQNAKVCD